MDTAEIKNMSNTEKLQAMDALSGDDLKVESPEWHKEILANRKHKIASGEAAFYSLDEVKTRHKK